MTLRAITITHTDRAWHEAFLQFVPRVFPSVSFRSWYEHGGWDERYSVFALADGDELVASASAQRMAIVLNGQRRGGCQLGAVGTDPARRGQGLQDRVLRQLLAATQPGDVVFLFANDSVLDFYPRYGFQRVREACFAVPLTAAPVADVLPVLDRANAADRALLFRISASALPLSDRFAALDYGKIVLWYWCNFYPDGLRYDAPSETIFVVEQQGDVLHVYDVLSAAPVALASYVPRLIRTPVRRVELGFSPERVWPGATVSGEYTESPLFVRAPQELPHTPFKFPMLAQT